MAGHNVRFSADYNWIQPIAIRGYDTTLALLIWFFQHSQVQGNWIKFDYLSKSDGELTALRTAVPDLGTLTRDLGSFRTLLFHLSNHQRFSDEQNEAISTHTDPEGSLGWLFVTIQMVGHSEKFSCVLATYKRNQNPFWGPFWEKLHQIISMNNTWGGPGVRGYSGEFPDTGD